MTKDEAIEWLAMNRAWIRLFFDRGVRTTKVDIDLEQDCNELRDNLSDALDALDAVEQP